MAAYSLDLRKRIVDAIERGVGTRSDVAKLFGVHESFVYKLLRQKRQRGDIAPLPHDGGAQAKLNEDQLMILSDLVAESPATMSIEGAVDTQVFDAYVKKFLVPSLLPGDIALLDNVKFHYSERSISLIEAAGARVKHIPAYSPDFSPIEGCISKIKGALRKAKARTERGYYLPMFIRQCSCRLVSIREK
jgi:transposase